MYCAGFLALSYSVAVCVSEGLFVSLLILSVVSGYICFIQYKCPVPSLSRRTLLSSDI